MSNELQRRLVELGNRLGEWGRQAERNLVLEAVTALRTEERPRINAAGPKVSFREARTLLEVLYEKALKADDSSPTRHKEDSLLSAFINQCEEEADENAKEIRKHSASYVGADVLLQYAQEQLKEYEGHTKKMRDLFDRWRRACVVDGALVSKELRAAYALWFCEQMRHALHEYGIIGADDGAAEPPERP